MHNRRIKILLSIIIALISVLIFRLGYIQIFENSKYSGISEDRRIKRTPIDALRGKIYDRTGVVLATNRHTFNVAVKYNDLLYYYLKREDKFFPRLLKLKAHKKDFVSCDECHAKEDEMFAKLIDISVSGEDGLFETVKSIVKRVERIKESVSKRKGKEIRVLEEISFHHVVKDIAFDKVAELEVDKKRFPGIHVEVMPSRWYPYGSLASHILGYTDVIRCYEWDGYGFNNNPFDCDTDGDQDDGEELVDEALIGVCDGMEAKKLGLNRMFSSGYGGYVLAGRTGVEAYYNLSLLGKPGERFSEVTVGSSKIDKVIIEQPSKAGENIVLTMDGGLQLLAEKALGDRTGSVVVMDPRNGEIIVMASNPRFDPNTFKEDFSEILKNKRKPLLNRPLQGTLPPGSTFKIVTAVGALAEGVISDKMLVKCSGRLGSERNRFRCSSKYGHGMISVEEALEHSCNVYFYEVGKRLGSRLWRKWSEKFGFGTYSGVDVPYERKGLLPTPASSFEMMNVAIGQGSLLVSPIQITRMMAIIANGGYDVAPHILRGVTDYSGRVVLKSNDKNGGESIVPGSVVDVIKRGLVKVVTSGTARNIGIENYLVAGKTGTAEIRKEGNNHAWFTGFAPYDNPRYCFTVQVENTPEHAAEATAPIIQLLMAGLFPEKRELTAKNSW